MTAQLARGDLRRRDVDGHTHLCVHCDPKICRFTVYSQEPSKSSAALPNASNHGLLIAARGSPHSLFAQERIDLKKVSESRQQVDIARLRKARLL